MASDVQLNTAADRGDSALGEADAARFHTLFTTHYGPLCRYAGRLLGDPEQAGDVVQDVFVRLWERRDAWDADRAAAPYLYRAVRHRSFDLARHGNVVERHLESEGHSGNLPPPSLSDPERNLSLAELRRAISAAVDALPARQRDAFVLSRTGGLTYAEIAVTLGVSVKAVEKRMSLAFRTLYVALGPYR